MKTDLVQLLLSNLENIINPDIIFTLFGPSYWRPQNKNLMGFADPWILNKKSTAYQQLNIINKIITKLRNFYKIYHLKKESNYFIIETKDGKDKLSNLLRTQIKKYLLLVTVIVTFFQIKIFYQKK